jgi:chloramphenicol-sensitive protein RarD
MKVQLKMNKFYGAGIMAFVIWGFVPFPLRALSGYPSGQILYFRILSSVAILLVLTLLFNRQGLRDTLSVYRQSPLPEQRRFLVMLPLSGVLLGINWFTFIYVVNHVDIQTGSFSYLLCPILTALLGFLLLKEKLKANQWIAIAISLLSCSLIGTGSFVNLLLSLFIASSYALYLITQRVLKQYDKIILMTMTLLVTSLLIGPFYHYFNAGHQLGLDWYFFGVMAVLSIAFTIIPLFLNLYALKELKSGTVGILLYINPIINFVMAFWYFGEQTTPRKALAYVLILLSIVIYNVKFSKKGKKIISGTEPT